VTILGFVIILGADLLSVLILLPILFENNVVLLLVCVLCGREELPAD
jgi:hypothetical protein